LPGSGSLVAGHPVGYAQLALALGGFGLSAIFGARFILWQLANWSRFHGQQGDPVAELAEIWLHLRWALFGMVVVFIAFLWALMTSLAILRSATNENAARETPPRL
jgi:hypothetical protein